MFIAIVVPSAKSSRPTLLCVAAAALANCLLRILPSGARPAPALSMLLAGVGAAALSAWLFPKKEDAE
jgi:predicted branched-subunit amino acid permease